MIYLRVKCTYQQVRDILDKHYPINVGVCTFPKDKGIHYIALNDGKEKISKVLMTITEQKIDMEVISEHDMELLSPIYQKPPMSNSPDFIGDYNLFPFGINYRTNI